MAKQPRRTLSDALSTVTVGKEDRPEDTGAPVPVATPAKAPISPQTVRASLYLPKAVHRQLRELAFANDRKMHDYLLEGLDLVFRQHGLRPINELTAPKNNVNTL